MVFFNIRAGKWLADDIRELEGFVSDQLAIDRNGLGFFEEMACLLLADLEGVVALVETDHVDATFRDAFYTHFSRRHFHPLRESVRVSFFEYYLDEGRSYGRAEKGAFQHAYHLLSWIACDTDTLNDHYLGSCVLNPLVEGAIGRTLLKPSRMLSYGGSDVIPSDEDIPALIRTSTYKLTVGGKPLKINSFPFHQQDGELMSCAEVTILNIMKYYSNEYAGYPNVEPSDIIRSERRVISQRVTPSRGLNYEQVSRILGDFGLHPCLYDRSAIEATAFEVSETDRDLSRLVFTYVESGIPVALNADYGGNNHGGHSLICVGHTAPRPSREEYAWNQALLVNQYTVDPHGKEPLPLNERESEEKVESTRSVGIIDSPYAILDAADLCDGYVLIDDNQQPFSIRRFDSITSFDGYQIARFISALHRGITLEAQDARSKFQRILADPSTGLVQWRGGWLESKFGNAGSARDRTIVARVFLASSRRFKTERVAHVADMARASAYAEVPLPHFVWVCELFLADEYFSRFTCGGEDVLAAGTTIDGVEICRAETKQEAMTPHAFAELVMDATTEQPSGDVGGIVLCNYPEKLAVRFPDGARGEMKDWVKVSPGKDYRGIPAFCGNLQETVPE